MKVWEKLFFLCLLFAIKFSLEILNMEFKLNKQVFCSFIFIVLAFLSQGCSVDTRLGINQTSPKTLPITQVFIRDTILHQEYVADIQAVRNVELRARVEGFLEEIYVDEGQKVKKGQLLFRLNAEEYQAELAKAKANHKSAVAESKAAELEVKRLKVLVDKNVIAKSELDVALARLNAVYAKIEESRWAQSNAKQRLTYTAIRAPFDGIIDRIPFKAGSLIGHGTLLTTVSDVSAVNVYFNVSEGEYLEYVRARIKNGGKSNPKVSLVLADGTPFPFSGTIETMEGEFHSNTGSIAFRARFSNPDMVLKHGATGKIRMARRIDGAVMVHQKAVFEIQDKYYVFLLDSNNRSVMKNFVPRTRFSHYFIVESGLEPGDKIVFEGIRDVKEGMQIIPQPLGIDSIVSL